MKWARGAGRPRHLQMTPEAIAIRERKALARDVRAFLDARGEAEDDFARRIGVDVPRAWALLGATPPVTTTAERERIAAMLASAD